MIQLRVRTEYSFGQVYAPINRIIERLKAQGCTAAAIVDGASTWGHVPWFKACYEVEIQPLLGVELVVVEEGDAGPRMWFIAKNGTGLSELYQATSLAHRQPMVTKFGSVPRLYRADVETMSDNIFKFAGEITDGVWLKSIDAVLDLSPASRILNAKKRSLVAEHGLLLVETSDNAYAFEEDRATFELITSYHAGGPGLKPSPQYLIDLPVNPDTQAIADACAGLDLPKAPMIHFAGNLESVCREGIVWRKMNWSEEYETRLQYELELIRSKDFESYFLVVADMVHYAKRHMLVGPSRGSAAGSLVCYTARITEIDPIPPRLYFERFIDVSRTDLPDIDLDFPDNKRHMVFDYMAEKYGAENVSHIGNVNRFKPKSALIQVCKALGIPPAATAAVKVAMIERSSADSRANNCLEDTLKDTEPGRAFMAAYPQAAMAQQLEGHASHSGVHAAGLLVCTEPIQNYCTVDGDGIAQIDYRDADTLGLLKVDVLGLRTLGVLEDGNVDIDWYNLPMNDTKTFDIFNSGRLCGIFQFEGNALRAISREIDFQSITEIDAVTALARPGPFGGGVTEKYVKRKKGEAYKSIHPLVEAHMNETFGLPVYQEQTLAIVREIGKFDWTETSTIRKAMSKRMGKEFFESYWGKFKIGAASQGIEEKQARETWELINAMGAWQMNKAHTYSYAVISYWTAYFKAHHPLEFAAANLRNAKDEDSAKELLREMVREGIEYVPFNLETSQLNWSVQNGKLIGGFTALKGIGESKAAKLIDARDKGNLTAKQVAEIEKAENTFSDLFPMHRLYSSLYEDPKANNVIGRIVDIVELVEGIPHAEERVFIAELIHKNARDANEEVNVKKRGGKIVTGPVNFVDVRFRDDTGMIGGRISRFDYVRIGKRLLEDVPLGAHLLVRAKFFNGIRYAFVSKWKRLDV